jgi:hypothetical protein
VSEVFTKLDKVTFKTTNAQKFEPVLITRHSQRLAELLDRCLSLRKDVRELEVLEVKAATDYDLFNSTSKIDEQTEILRLQVDSKSSEQKGFQAASTAFKKSTTTLENGLSEISDGRDAALGADLKTSGDLQGLIETRWKNLRDYQDAYHARYTEPGNAHNYGERATLLLEVLNVLLDEALARADALATGINLIYGVKIDDVPGSVTLTTVDDFAVWALKVIRSLSHAAENETTSEIVIPLVQPWLPTGQPLIGTDAFNNEIANAGKGQPVLLNFDFPKNDLVNGQARLKSIGVSFGNQFELVEGSGIDRNQTADVFTRLTLKIVLPRQSAGDGTSYQRPDILMGNVGLHSVSGTASVEGNAIENLSPFGQWQVAIHPFLVWKDGTKRIVSEKNFSAIISDLKLAFRFYVPAAYTSVNPRLKI